QRQLEEDLGAEEAKNTTIAGKDIGRKIFSEDTDRIILENLMNNGIKDETGSLLEAHFKNFLHAHPTLTAKQVRFMNLLKNYIAQHGSIIVDKLYEAPFTSVSHEGIDSVFTADDVGELIAVLKPFLKQEAPHGE